MRFIAALLASAALALPARAVTVSTDFSDLWSILPAEDGWGANIVQQNDVLFITLFVYGPDNKPTWYVGPLTALAGVTQEGAIVFEGPLYATTGPWFGAATYDLALRQSQQVGAVQFAASDISAGKLVYSVGDRTVEKNVRRQTWRGTNLTGSYRGASVASYAGCGAADNGYREHTAIIDIIHNAGLSAITVREETGAYTCTYTGAYSVAGRMGQINANGTCTDGRTPVFLATEVQASIEGLTMRFSNNFGNACTSVGRMGGIRRAS